MTRLFRSPPAASCRLRTLLALAVLCLVGAAAFTAPSSLSAQTAKERWERLRQIRLDKFDHVLPRVMRANDVDMWITMIREANYGTLHVDFGEGYTSDYGFYVFTDRGGERIERAALGITGYRIERSDAYDLFAAADSLGEFVKERDPRRIALNFSRAIGPADQLTHTAYQQIREMIGAPYAERIVSAERLVSDFRSQRVASEIAAFGEAGEISRAIAERAFSNEVITPGRTRLEDVAWWMAQQQLERGLGSSFGMPSVYITGPDGVEALSNERIIQPGDVLMLDWGVGFLNFFTDMKRIAYVLRDGETEAPAGIRHAFERGLAARQVVKQAIRPGPTAGEVEDGVYEALRAAGFQPIGFNQPTEDASTTDVVIGCHSVGNTGHGIGPSVAFFNPVRREFPLLPTNLLSIELFAYTAVPEWGNKKLRIPLEDDAVVTERGVEWLYPANRELLLIR